MALNFEFGTAMEQLHQDHRIYHTVYNFAVINFCCNWYNVINKWAGLQVRDISQKIFLHILKLISQNTNRFNITAN